MYTGDFPQLADKTTSKLLLINWFISTKMKAMKRYINLISLRIFVRTRQCHFQWSHTCALQHVYICTHEYTNLHCVLQTHYTFCASWTWRWQLRPLRGMLVKSSALDCQVGNSKGEPVQTLKSEQCFTQVNQGWWGSGFFLVFCRHPASAPNTSGTHTGGVQ